MFTQHQHQQKASFSSNKSKSIHKITIYVANRTLYVLHLIKKKFVQRNKCPMVFCFLLPISHFPTLNRKNYIYSRTTCSATTHFYVLLFQMLKKTPFREFIHFVWLFPPSNCVRTQTKEELYMRDPFCCKTLARSFDSCSRPIVVPMHSFDTTHRNSTESEP